MSTRTPSQGLYATIAGHSITGPRLRLTLLVFLLGRPVDVQTSTERMDHIGRVAVPRPYARHGTIGVSPEVH